MGSGKNIWNSTKLMIFDMDGVLTQHPSSWIYIHERIGVDNDANYELFKKRKITYNEFLKSDVELWKVRLGEVHRSQIESILAEIPFSLNLRKAIMEIKSKGVKVAIVSAGISWLADMINREVEFDYSYSNSIYTSDDGTLIPDGPGEVDPLGKDIKVQQLQSALGIGSEETISVGDTDQDIPMFRKSGISISFNPASEDVIENSDISIRSKDLYSIITKLDNYQ